ISGATPGSASGGEDDENDGRVVPPPHAPSSNARQDMAARLATPPPRAELIMAFPPKKSWPQPPRSPAPKRSRGKGLPQSASDSNKFLTTPSYIRLTKGLTHFA